MNHKRTNGYRVGNIQFGYRLGADGKHVEPDAAEQAVLEGSATCAIAATPCGELRLR